MHKHSRQRDMILDYLKGTKSHPTPEQIFDDLRVDNPELGIATVYRNLKMLFEQGLIRKLDVGQAADRYDADISNHYHLICECCGGVSDIYEDDIDISFKRQTGHKVNNFEIYCYGICSKCLKN